MRNKKTLLVIVLLSTISGSLALAKISSPLQDAKISAEATLNAKTGIYRYTYMVFNPPINDGQIFLFEIDISKKLSSIELSSEGLIIQRGISARGTFITRSFEEEIAKKNLEKAVIPIGAQPPLSQSFPGWTVGISAMRTVMWGGSERNLILPNQTLEGFVATSYGLPSIREATLQPVIDYDNLPEEYYGNIELTKQLQDSLTYHTKTIGPTAPPADFKPLDFLDYIISMKHEASSLGWITNKGIEQSLDVKLENARKKIERGQNDTAKEILKAFINEVEAQGCESYDDCPKGKHLTPEAYALLRYNVQYLVERL